MSIPTVSIHGLPRPSFQLGLAWLISLFSTFLAPGATPAVPAAAVPLDFGDAPAPYPTTLAQNGPRHRIIPGFHLGASIDNEANGQPSPTATGDGSDEDGILAVEPAVVGSSITLVLRASTAGFLDGFIDLNRDGDLSDPGEKVLHQKPLVAGENLVSVLIPPQSSTGPSLARLRFSSVGGLGSDGPADDGEVEDYRIVLTEPSAAADVRAWYEDGQVWVVWSHDRASAPETYCIYAANQTFTNTAQATLIGRLFRQEWDGTDLRQQVRHAFNREITGYSIPDGTPQPTRYQLRENEGVFVETVRATSAKFYAVLPWGRTNVAPGAITTNRINAPFDLQDPPELQPQTTGLRDVDTGIPNAPALQYPVTFGVLWADGDSDENAGRPDFPIFANPNKRGSPHIYLVVEPRGGVGNATHVPAAFGFHGADADATAYLPDSLLPKAINALPTEGYLIAPDEQIWLKFQGRVVSQNTSWFGYARGFDPFGQNERIGDRYPLPADTDTVVNYTQRQLVWIMDWFTRRKNVDPQRFALLGYSNGGMGANAFMRSFPERFSTVSIYHTAFRFEDNIPGILFRGDEFQNLPTTVRNASGQPVRFTEIYAFGAPFSGTRDLPLLRLFHGKCDESDVMHWGPDLVAKYRDMDGIGWGNQLFWDLTPHGPDQWNDHWIAVSNTASLRLQTRRDDLAVLNRFRNDQSFPAFHNHQVHPDHGDPGPGYLGSTFLARQCGLAVDAQGNPVNNGDNHGTWGGFFDWINAAGEPGTITDLTNRWECTVFVQGTNHPSGYPVSSAVDVPPQNSLTADLAIRRPQLFQPAPGSALAWVTLQSGTSIVLQRGTLTVPADGLVRLPAVVVPQYPDRIRVIVGLPSEINPPRPPVIPIERALGVTEWQIDPNTTVPSTITNHFAPDASHVVMLSRDAARRDRLVLYLPGAKGTPTEAGLFQEHAARLGFHVIGLSYDSRGSTTEACATSPDPDCFQKRREDVLFRNPASPDVDEFNAVLNRLELLLHWLAANQPAQNWDDYLHADGSVNWSRVIVAGHSLGGGHAGMLGKRLECARVVMFSHDDWMELVCRPAPWQGTTPATPAHRWFAFTHAQDTPAFSHAPVTWQAFGITRYGDLVDVDSAAPPYQNSHTLTTRLTPTAAGNAPEAPVLDRSTPLDARGVPMFLPVWTHLLTGPELLSPPPTLIADSVRDFTSTQGSNGWHYGYWDATQNPNFLFTPLPSFGATRFHFPAWVLQSVPLTPPQPEGTDACEANRTNHVLTAVWSTGAELNTHDPITGNPRHQAPVRRWVSSVQGPIQIEGHLAMLDLRGPTASPPGDGVEGVLRVNGLPIWSGRVSADDPLGIAYQVRTNIQPGQFIDLVLLPGSTANGDHDAARFTARILTDCSTAGFGNEQERPELETSRNAAGHPQLTFQPRTGRNYRLRGSREPGQLPNFHPGPMEESDLGTELARSPNQIEMYRTNLVVDLDLGTSLVRNPTARTVQIGPAAAPELDDVISLTLPGRQLEGFFQVLSDAPATTDVPRDIGIRTLGFSHDCRQRRYILAVPRNYNPAQPAPLGFILHGGGQTARDFALAHHEIFREADQSGMILVLPQAMTRAVATPTGTAQQIQWSTEDPTPDQVDFVDDVGFLRALLEHLRQSLAIDPARVGVAGFSNGGRFAYFLASRTHGLFSSFAVVGGFIGTGIPGQPMSLVPPPAEPLPLLVVHGGDDLNVPFEGGRSASGLERSSVPAAVAQWLSLHPCALTQASTTNGVPPSQVATRTYTACQETPTVVLQAVRNLPHSWPDAGDTHNGAPVGFDANAEVIRFLHMQRRSR